MLSLSIVIPSRARGDLLRICLDRLFQARSVPSEVIVVDDGSPEAGAARVALDYPGVRAIRLPRSRGFCVAANHGLVAARGQIIQLLNDDTEVAPGWDLAALEVFRDPRVGAVAPLVFAGTMAEGEKVIDSAGDGYDAGGFAWKIGRRQPMSDLFRVARDVPGASASSVFLRRAALERVGLFPEPFGAYFEDVDLSRRLLHAGYAIRFEPACRVWHRGGSSYGKPSRRLIEQQSRNEERVFWRHWGDSPRARTLLRHLAVLGGKAIRRIRAGDFAPFALGRLRAWSELARRLLTKELPACPTLPPLPGPC
jgi:GT2 family glycosyltransferase